MDEDSKLIRDLLQYLTEGNSKEDLAKMYILQLTTLERMQLVREMQEHNKQLETDQN